MSGRLGQAYAGALQHTACHILCFLAFHFSFGRGDGGGLRGKNGECSAKWNERVKVVHMGRYRE